MSDLPAQRELREKGCILITAEVADTLTKAIYGVNEMHVASHSPKCGLEKSVAVLDRTSNYCGTWLVTCTFAVHNRVVHINGVIQRRFWSQRRTESAQMRLPQWCHIGDATCQL
jgi:hypothetical protein